MRAKTIFRNTTWTVLDSIASAACNLGLSIIVARKMGPERLGDFNYVMWMTYAIALFGTAGISAATRKYVAEYLGRGDIAQARAIVRSTFGVQLVFAMVFTSIGALITWYFVAPRNQAFTALAVASLFPYLLLGVFGQALAATENFLPNVQASLAATVVSVGGSLWGLYHGWGLEGLTGSLFASRVVDLSLRAIQYRRLFPKASGPIRTTPAEARELRMRMLRFYGQVSILMLLNVVVWDRSELLFLKKFSPITEVAFYSLSFNIGTNLIILPSLFAQATGATLMVDYGRDRSKMGQLCSTATRYLCLCAFPIILGMAALSSPVLRIAYGERYVQAIPVLTLVALFSLPRAMMQAIYQQIVANERVSFLVVWGLITGVINIGADLLFIPRGGAIGAAYANGIAQSITSAGIIIYGIRQLDVRLRWDLILKTLLSAVAMGAGVYLVARPLPSLAAVVIGVPLGVMIYFAALKWIGVLLPEDYTRLSVLGDKLPGVLRRQYRTILRYLVANKQLAVD